MRHHDDEFSARMAVVEEQIAQMRQVADDRHEDLSRKLDLVISGQIEGKLERAETRHEVAGIKASIEKMEPHITTIADVKKFVQGVEKAWSFTGKLGMALTAIGGAGYWLWTSLRAYLSAKGH